MATVITGRRFPNPRQRLLLSPNVPCTVSQWP
jgi:hypothetical protein